MVVEVDENGWPPFNYGSARKSRSKVDEVCDDPGPVENSDEPGSGESALLIENLATVTTSPLKWVWDGLIPRGKLTLVTGEAGIGKSLVALQVAAMVTRGCRTPDFPADEASPEEEPEKVAGPLSVEEPKKGTDVLGPDPTNESDISQPDSHDGSDKLMPEASPTESGVSGADSATGSEISRPEEPEMGLDLLRTEEPKTETDPLKPRGAVSVSGTKSEKRPGAVVLLVSADDDVADTVRPRLETAGADIDRVFVLHCDRITGDISLMDGRSKVSKNAVKRHAGQGGSAGMNPFEHELEKLEVNLHALRDSGVDVHLIVIDSIDQYLRLPKKNRMHSGIVARLAELAFRSGAAILVVANSVSPRIGGSGYQAGRLGLEDFFNAARTVLLIVQDLDRKHRRLMLAAKRNLSENRAGMAFSIHDGAVKWRSQRILTTVSEYFVNSVAQLRNPLYREETTELNRAMKWLRESLSLWPVSSISIQWDARDNGISHSTLRRAYSKLCCVAFKKPGKKIWFWALPHPNPTASVYSYYDPKQAAQDLENEQH